VGPAWTFVAGASFAALSCAGLLVAMAGKV
jgi:hypothetical protein